MHYKGSTYMTEERIKLAGEEKKDRLYEPKQNQKAIKVLTVAAYVLCVSLAAIMLSSYYLFIWNPTAKPNLIQPRTSNCDKIVIPENVAIRLANLANASQISLETFLKNYSVHFTLGGEAPKMIEIVELKSYQSLFERIEQSTLKNSLEPIPTKKATEKLPTNILDNTLKKNIELNKKENDEDVDEEDDDDDDDDEDDEDENEAGVDTETGDYEPSGEKEMFIGTSNTIQNQLINNNSNTDFFEQTETN